MERYNFLAIEKKWREHSSANSVQNVNSKKIMVGNPARELKNK